jgi:anti-sigma factor RsiW
MFKTQNHYMGGDGHIAADRIAMFLDGELPNHEAAAVQHHLEECWSCRQASADAQQAVSAFVEYRRRVLALSSGHAPTSIDAFAQRLHQRVESIGCKTQRISRR